MFQQQVPTKNCPQKVPTNSAQKYEIKNNKKDAACVQEISSKIKKDASNRKKLRHTGYSPPHGHALCS